MSLRRTESSRRSASRGRSSAYTVLDLFSGAGGFSLGLEAAGFETVGAVEIDEKAAAAFQANFGDRPIQLFGKSEGDMRRVQPRTIRRLLRSAGIDELDLLVAGPPCQGFSRVGRGKLDSLAEESGAFLLDPRNHLYRQAVALLTELRPRIFLFENVAGILHVKGRNVADLVCAAITRAGYRANAALLNSAWYGVPQSRERVIIVGTRADLDIGPAFPTREYTVPANRGRLSEASMNPALWRTPEYFVPFDELPARSNLSPAITAREALRDLPSFTAHLHALRTGGGYRPRRESVAPVEYRTDPPNPFCRLMRNWPGLPSSSEVRDHFCRWTPRDFDTFAQMNPNDRYGDAIIIAEARYQAARSAYLRGRLAHKPLRRDFVPPYPTDVFNDKWRKLDPGQPSHTITAHLAKDSYSHIHFNSRQRRAITIREAARLQSFPDSFTLIGNMGDAFTQIGNAVPPLLARALGRRLRRLLELVDNRNSARSRPALRAASGM